MNTYEKIKRLIKDSVPYFLRHELWKDSRVTPFLRFARLQLIFALGEKKAYLRWFDNLMLPLQKGEWGLTGNYYVGLHEFRDMAFAIHLLRPGDVFLDIGSNLGSYSLLASGVVGAQSIAFEPVPETYERLSENIAVNRLCNLIEARQIALTSPENALGKKGLIFSTDRGACNSFVASDYPGSKVSIDVSTLDEQIKGFSPALLKIDVEGFEEDVLKGAISTLGSSSVLAVIIEGQIDAVNKQFLETGYEDIEYHPLTRKIHPHKRDAQNRIWIKKELRSTIQERLETAPKRFVYGRMF